MRFFLPGVFFLLRIRYLFLLMEKEKNVFVNEKKKQKNREMWDFQSPKDMLVIQRPLKRPRVGEKNENTGNRSVTPMKTVLRTVQRGLVRSRHEVKL